MALVPAPIRVGATKVVPSHGTPFRGIWAVLMGAAWAWVPADAGSEIPWLLGYLIVGSALGAYIGNEVGEHYDDDGPIGRWAWRLLTGAFAVVVRRRGRERRSPITAGAHRVA